LLVGDQHSLVQTRLINRMPDSSQSIEPLLATLALIEEVTNCLLDQFIAASVVAAGEFLIDLFCQIRRQRYIAETDTGIAGSRTSQVCRSQSPHIRERAPSVGSCHRRLCRAGEGLSYGMRGLETQFEEVSA
jgi:hypothetical protein